MAKNKIAPPFRIVEMDILFGTGIDTVSCLLDAAEDAGIFTRKGSWYSYDGKNVAQVTQWQCTLAPGTGTIFVYVVVFHDVMYYQVPGM